MRFFVLVVTVAMIAVFGSVSGADEFATLGDIAAQPMSDIEMGEVAGKDSLFIETGVVCSGGCPANREVTQIADEAIRGIATAGGATPGSPDFTLNTSSVIDGTVILP